MDITGTTKLETSPAVIGTLRQDVHSDPKWESCFSASSILEPYIYIHSIFTYMSTDVRVYIYIRIYTEIQFMHSIPFRYITLHAYIHEMIIIYQSSITV